MAAPYRSHVNDRSKLAVKLQEGDNLVVAIRALLHVDVGISNVLVVILGALVDVRVEIGRAHV